MGEFSNSKSFQGKNDLKSVFLGKYFLTGDTVDTVFVYLWQIKFQLIYVMLQINWTDKSLKIF